MSLKKLMDKLTPSHFAKGESFDKEAFALSIGALKKSKSILWKQMLVWMGFFLLGVFFESYKSYPIYAELKYTLENGLLTILR